MEVLVTGAGGKVGAKLVTELSKQNCNVLDLTLWGGHRQLNGS
jgi:uncharacterized protein YbjT (DUF2867 family)